MENTTAAELLADRQFRRAVFRWKPASWSRLFAELARDLDACFAGQRVLEVGAHEGGLSLLFAQLGASVTSSDIRVDYSSRQRETHRAWGVNCSYAVLDVTHPVFEPGSFDLIVMKSVLGGVHAVSGPEGVRQALEGFHAALRPGGACIILEQLTGDPVSRLLRRWYFRGRHWHYFLASELSPSPLGLLGKFTMVRTVRASVLAHVCEEWFDGDSWVVRMAVQVDRVLERMLPGDWLHLVGVVVMKERQVS